MCNPGDCFESDGSIYVYMGKDRALHVTNSNGRLVIDECGLPKDAVSIDLKCIDSVDVYLYALIAHMTARIVAQCHTQTDT